jgi:hypothetical protein
MSYSRWLGSEWYTYWMSQPKETENRDTALFDICTVQCFTAKELRENIDKCLQDVKKICPEGDLEELKVYMKRFLKDVDEEYPK